jgi:hypothetical protein
LAVAIYLAKHGIDEKRLSVTGFALRGPSVRITQPKAEWPTGASKSIVADFSEGMI